MTRVKKGRNATHKREKLLKFTKGFKWGRKSKERAAKEAVLHAWSNAFAGRKQKKRDYRALWQNKIGAVAKAEGTSYSQLIGGLKKANILLDRKILADLAKNNLAVFKKVAEKAK